MTKIISLVALAIMSISTPVFAAAEIVTVAVFDFNSRDESLKESGKNISALLQAALSASENVITVERAELDKILGEQELGVSGTVSSDSAAKIGKLTGAKILISGQVFKIDKEITCVAKLISAETSRVFAESAKSQTVSELSATLIPKLTALLNAKRSELAPSLVDREQALKTLIADNKKQRSTAVSVRIPEQHFGAPAADPAAETELKHILQETGFIVVDEKSDRKPDIEITGEAFSAMGLRKGNLISCKSRIELTARRRSDGSILTADRQTSVAVDITEQTAAKTALENAAREMAGRILTKL